VKSRFAPQIRPDVLLASICQALHVITRGLPPMTWVDLRKIEDRLGIASGALQAALELGMERRWLMTEGQPALRVALRDAGAAAVSRLAKRRARVA
jgi:hypothetical protein